MRQPLRERWPYLELSGPHFPTFGHAWTEYGDLLWKSSYSVGMRRNANQKNSEYGQLLRSSLLIQQNSNILYLAVLLKHAGMKDRILSKSTSEIWWNLFLVRIFNGYKYIILSVLALCLCKCVPTCYFVLLELRRSYIIAPKFLFVLHCILAEG